MKTQTTGTELQVSVESVEQRNLARIGMANSALLRLNVDLAIRLGWNALMGVQSPMRTPCGADAAGRAFIGRRWSDRISHERDLAEDWPFAAFEVENPNWRCPAHHLGVPYRTMVTETIPKLKKYAANIAYAPSLRFGRIEEELVCKPVLRVLVFGLGLGEYDAGSIDSVRRALGRGRGGSPAVTRFRPLSKKLLAGEIEGLLALQPRRQPLASLKATPAQELNALLQLSALATLPMTLIAGGVGIGKSTLSGAMGEWKASLKNRTRTKRLLASNEIFPLLSDILIEVNGTRARLPFWHIE